MQSTREAFVIPGSPVAPILKSESDWPRVVLSAFVLCKPLVFLGGRWRLASLPAVPRGRVPMAPVPLPTVG